MSCVYEGVEILTLQYLHVGVTIQKKATVLCKNNESLDKILRHFDTF